MKTKPRLWRNLLLATVVMLTLIAISALLGSLPQLERFSFASAYTALLLLAVTLTLGPWWRLRGRSTPMSSTLRRDIGIAAAMVGSLHVILGLQVHFKGRMWLYFVSDSGSPRADLFGLANYSGLLATVILLALLAASNTLAVSRLGIQRWKRLQRFNYLLLAMVALHGVIYQLLEKRQLVGVISFGLVLALVAWMQFLGYRRTVAQRASVPR